ncbi:MAG: hypothetical protein IT369_23850 [Candidatus Latescibacteria bacterium]|nr:hypothetical protein [Candidatus Latescibacterota bacterium]
MKTKNHRSALYPYRCGAFVFLTALLIGADRLPYVGVDALSAATRPGQAVVGSGASDYPLLQQPQPRTTQLDDAAVETLVRWSDDLSYGVGNSAPPGTTYLLLVPTVRPEATTSPQVLRGVIELCARSFTNPVIGIGIRGPVPDSYIQLVAELADLVEVKVVPLQEQPPRALPLPDGLLSTNYELPQALVQADAVILVPALWRDQAGRVFGALETLGAAASAAALSDSLRVDLLGAVEPLYVFADALRPALGGEIAPLNARLAGDDIGAVDAVGAQLLGASPAQVPGLLLVGEHMLGKVEWAEIKLNGAPVPGVPQGAQPFEGPAGPQRSQ